MRLAYCILGGLCLLASLYLQLSKEFDKGLIVFIIGTLCFTRSDVLWLENKVEELEKSKGARNDLP
jgi:hypothetical protein